MLRSLLLASLILAPFVTLVVIQQTVNESLRAAVGEADRLDPGWRLEDLQARRETLPDEHNGARRVVAVARALPDDWKKSSPGPVPPDWTSCSGLAIHEALRSAPPSVLLTDRQADAVAAESRRVAEALEAARALARFPRGRYTIDYRNDYFRTNIGELNDARTVARLLEFDVVARAQAGDVDGALASSRALLNAGRSIGDEPDIIAQLVRMAVRAVTAQSVERAVALGEPADAALAAVQNDLLRELAEPAGLTAVRGERAKLFDMFRRLGNGEVTLQQLGAENPQEADGQGSSFGGIGYLFYANNQAISLRFLSQAVEIVKKPGPEQSSLWARWRAESSVDGKPSLRLAPGILAYLAMPNLDASARADVRSKANLGECVAAVGVERFRLSKRRWPDSLDEVERTLSITLPIDPYTLTPFRFKRTENGVVVYSVSSDGIDNGGALDNSHPDRAGADLGYRLWDVGKRRQTAVPRSEH